MKDNRLKETKKKITKEKGQNSRRQKMTIDVAFKSLQIVIDMEARRDFLQLRKAKEETIIIEISLQHQ